MMHQFNLLLCKLHKKDGRQSPLKTMHLEKSIASFYQNCSKHGATRAQIIISNFWGSNKTRKCSDNNYIYPSHLFNPYIFCRSLWRGNSNPSSDETEHGWPARPTDKSCTWLSWAVGTRLSWCHWKVRHQFNEFFCWLIVSSFYKNKMDFFIYLLNLEKHSQDKWEKLAFMLGDWWKNLLEIQRVMVVRCLLMRLEL